MKTQQPPPKRARYSKKQPDEVTLLECNDCFILKQALLFMGDSLEEAGNVMLVSREWRKVAVNCEPLWTSLLLRRYPNLRAARQLAGSSEKARNVFLGRLRLDCDPGAPVRKLGQPSALRTPPQCLIQMWKPKSVLFLVDIRIDSVRVASESFRVPLVSKNGQLVLQDNERKIAPESKVKTMQLDLKENKADAAEKLKARDDENTPIKQGHALLSARGRPGASASSDCPPFGTAMEIDGLEANFRVSH